MDLDAMIDSLPEDIRPIVRGGFLEYVDVDALLKAEDESDESLRARVMARLLSLGFTPEQDAERRRLLAICGPQE
jgi:hypothetical protein